MAASANATRVFWGTAWTAHTLLAREKRPPWKPNEAMACGGCSRSTPRQVGEEVPAYEQFVLGEIARHGRQHPLVRSQFFSEEIDGQAGMFPSRRLLMVGTHPFYNAPIVDGCEKISTPS